MTASEENVQRQLGVISTQILALQELLKDRQLTASRENDETKSELRNIKHEQRNLEQRVGDINYKLDRNDDRIKDITERLEDMREPVEHLMQLRTRAGGIFIFMTAIGGAAWLCFETVGKWFMERWLNGPPPPTH